MLKLFTKFDLFGYLLDGIGLYFCLYNVYYNSLLLLCFWIAFSHWNVVLRWTMLSVKIVRDEESILSFHFPFAMSCDQCYVGFVDCFLLFIIGCILMCNSFRSMCINVCCWLYIVYILYGANHTNVTHTAVLNHLCIWSASGVVSVIIIIIIIMWNIVHPLLVSQVSCLLMCNVRDFSKLSVTCENCPSVSCVKAASLVCRDVSTFRKQISALWWILHKQTMCNHKSFTFFFSFHHDETW